jgi:hypothetical protein
MFKEKIPKGCEVRKVKLVDGSKTRGHMGKALVKEWTSQERIRRGFRNSFKLLSPILVVILPFAFLEPFLFMFWGSGVLFIVVAIAGPLLFAKYWGEQTSFFHVDGTCPHCKHEGRLRPYVHAVFADEFKVLCPECGETSIALAV